MDTQQTTTRRTVLVAEDDILLRMPLTEFLRGCGYKVLEALSAEEAITFLEHESFDVDIVLSNVVLAGDGFGIAKWIRDHQPGLPIVLTGSTKRTVEAAAALCEDGPLPAPFNPQILHRRMLRMLGSRKTGDGQDAKRIRAAQ